MESYSNLYIIVSKNTLFNIGFGFLEKQSDIFDIRNLFITCCYRLLISVEFYFFSKITLSIFYLLLTCTFLHSLLNCSKEKTNFWPLASVVCILSVFLHRISPSIGVAVWFQSGRPKGNTLCRRALLLILRR